MAALLLGAAGVGAPRASAGEQSLDPLLLFMHLIAEANDKAVVVDGNVVSFVDASDMLGAADPGADLVAAGVVDVPAVPAFLLSQTFSCANANVVCPDQGSADADFDEGAYLVVAQLAQGVMDSMRPGIRREFGPILQLQQYPTAPLQANNPFSGASHAEITRFEDKGTSQHLFVNQGGTFPEFRAYGRTVYQDDFVATLLTKKKDAQTAITGFEYYAFWSGGTAATTGRDNLFGFDGQPWMQLPPIATVAFEDAPPSSAVGSATIPPTTSAPATVAPASPSASQAPASGTSSGGGQGPWLLILLAGLGLAAVGVWLLRGRGGGPATPPGGVAMAAVDIGDPCPPLIAAYRAAKQACDEAMAAAQAASDTARARAADADAARAALERARTAREAAEKELERRQRPPDHGRSWAEGDVDGKHLRVDDYDLHLQEQARAAANARHDAAVAGASSEAERVRAHDEWGRELDDIDSPDGIERLRREDADGRAAWVKEAEEALRAAREAEAAAQRAADQAAGAATAAADAAAVAQRAADDACARAEAALRAAIDAGCLGPDGGPPPPKPPEPPQAPPVPPAPPIPPTPPSPPSAPGGGGPAPTPPTRERPHDCPDDAEPRITERNPIEVDLFLISESQLRIDSNYPYGDNIDDALDDLDRRLALVSAVMALPGAVTDPVPSILGTLGLPGFDTVTTAPATAAANSLRKLRERFEKFRRTGTWSLRVPLQHYRFSCRVTEECRSGTWVETKREFVGQRIGKPAWADSAPYEVQDVRYDGERAWRTMTAPFTRKNAAAEKAIGDAARSCGG